MTQTFNDRFNLNLILTVLFIAGIGASLYYIYSLPVSLRLANGYQPEFLKIYLVTGSTFLIGLSTVVSALRYKKEIVVFRDKIIDKEDIRKEAAEQAGKTTISLDVIHNCLSLSDKKQALTDSVKTICKQLDAGQGALYLATEENGKRIVELYAGYALHIGESTILKFEFGEGLVGQVASSGTTLYVDEVPEGYITILSGLGSTSPRYLLLVPVASNDRLAAVLEIATFHKVTEDQRKFVEEAAQLMTEKILAIG
jgi:putative methionine-R-sulfoxide reductase with GAF domain